MLDITNTNTGKLDWSITCMADWLTFTPDSGMYSDSVFISIDRSGFLTSEIIHYEYNGNFFSRLHCFDNEEKGELWDSMIIYVDLKE